jgi:hypothetical protein
MKKSIIASYAILTLLGGISSWGSKLFCQNKYSILIDSANHYFKSSNYQQAAETYRKAFETFGGKGYPDDRWNCGIAWAQLGNTDSAFYHLQRLADKTEYLDYTKLKQESLFSPLHADERWAKLLHELNPLNEQFNPELAAFLEDIRAKDQTMRLQIDSLELIYGRTSDYMRAHWKQINHIDSLNRIIVDSLLNQYGWLSPNVVGKSGNSALWLVIQHSPLPKQEYYLPIMKKAVDENKASKANYAYLLDRVLMKQGKKQLYGSQYTIDPKTGETVLWDIEDPENINIRRAEMKLGPIEIPKK